MFALSSEFHVSSSSSCYPKNRTMSGLEELDRSPTTSGCDSDQSSSEFSDGPDYCQTKIWKYFTENHYRSRKAINSYFKKTQANGRKHTVFVKETRKTYHRSDSSQVQSSIKKYFKRVRLGQTTINKYFKKTFRSQSKNPTSSSTQEESSQATVVGRFVIDPKPKQKKPRWNGVCAFMDGPWTYSYSPEDTPPTSGDAPSDVFNMDNPAPPRSSPAAASPAPSSPRPVLHRLGRLPSNFGKHDIRLDRMHRLPSTPNSWSLVESQATEDDDSQTNRQPFMMTDANRAAASAELSDDDDFQSPSQ